jgi:dTDP-4-dehydrorhamnose reductase
MAPSPSILSTLAPSRILITGGQGMLARSFRKQLAALAPEAQVWAPSRQELDVCPPEHLERGVGFAADLILHCAARVDADHCELHPEEAERSIVGGTRMVIDMAKATGARIVYPQSFLIHDGLDNPITEATEARPLSVYGRMKLAAEREVLAAADTSLVVCMAGFFGGGEADTNFVGKIVPHFARLLAKGETKIEIGDRVWQPTYTCDLALNTLVLAAQGKRGRYCMASHGQASFYDLALEITRILKIDDRLQVLRIDARNLAAREAARRPAQAIIHNSRLQAEGLDLQRPWQQALAAYLETPYFRDMFR